MMDLNQEQKTAYIKAMSQSGVKRIYRQKTLPKLGKHGTLLREYIKDGSDKEDLAAGKGIFLAGGLSKNPYLLPVFAKEQILVGRTGIFFMYLQELIWALTDEENRRTLERAQRANHLLLAWFQTEGDCPHSDKDIYYATQFLITRIEASRRTSFSACKRLHSCDWWPTELRGMLRGAVTEIVIDKRK